MTENEPTRPQGSIRSAQQLKWHLALLANPEWRAVAESWRSIHPSVQRALEDAPTLMEAPPLNRAPQWRMLKTLEAIPPEFWLAVDRAFAARGWSRPEGSISRTVGIPMPGEEGAAARALVAILLRAGRRKTARTRTQRKTAVAEIGEAVTELRNVLDKHVGIEPKTGETRGLEIVDAITAIERWLSNDWAGREMRLEAHAADPFEPYEYRDEAHVTNEIARRLQFTDMLTLLERELAVQTEPLEDDGRKSHTRQQRLTWELLTWFEAQYRAAGQRQRRRPKKVCIDTGKAILGALDPKLKLADDPLTGDRPAELRDRFDEFSGSTEG